MRRTLLMLLAVLAIAASPQPLTIDVSPRIGRAPQDIHIKTRVQPDERNRALCLVVDGPQYRSSCWELPGKAAPITTDTWLKDFPGGHYAVAVVLSRLEDGKRVDITRSVPVCVIGGVAEADAGCEGGSDGGFGLQD
jgi:hypothetical protein